MQSSDGIAQKEMAIKTQLEYMKVLFDYTYKYFKANGVEFSCELPLYGSEEVKQVANSSRVNRGGDGQSSIGTSIQKKTVGLSSEAKERMQASVKLLEKLRELIDLIEKQV